MLHLKEFIDVLLQHDYNRWAYIEIKDEVRIWFRGKLEDFPKIVNDEDGHIYDSDGNKIVADAYKFQVKAFYPDTSDVTHGHNTQCMIIEVV